MCGIGFFINYDKKKKLDLDLVEEVFIKLSWRGKDACGWYYERMENGIMNLKIQEHQERINLDVDGMQL